MKFGLIIPARFKSSRYPGKPLIDLGGKSMIRRVWERCVEAVGNDNVYIATDDLKIARHGREFTRNIVMTSERCLTGTDRVAEATEKLQLEYVINVQGDEQLIEPMDILKVKEHFEANPDSIVNAMCPISSEEEFRSVTIPKVVSSPSGKLLYMSRAPIPGNKEGNFNWGYKQVCIYAFSAQALRKFTSETQKTPLEQEEDIEIVRFLEMGFEVQMVMLKKGPMAVDTPADRARIIKIIGDKAE